MKGCILSNELTFLALRMPAARLKIWHPTHTPASESVPSVETLRIPGSSPYSEPTSWFAVKGTQRKWNAKIRLIFSKILHLQNRGCWKRNTPQKAFKNIITEIGKISERVGNKIEELSQKEQNVKMMENRRENTPTKTRGSMQKVQDSHIRGSRNKQRRKKLKEMNLQV